MAAVKSYGKKIRLLKKGRQNRRVPIWIMIKTNRRITSNPRRRSWRTTKLKM